MVPPGDAEEFPQRVETHRSRHLRCLGGGAQHAGEQHIFRVQGALEARAWGLICPQLRSKYQQWTVLVDHVVNGLGLIILQHAVSSVCIRFVGTIHCTQRDSKCGTKG